MSVDCRVNKREICLKSARTAQLSVIIVLLLNLKIDYPLLRLTGGFLTAVYYLFYKILLFCMLFELSKIENAENSFLKFFSKPAWNGASLTTRKISSRLYVSHVTVKPLNCASSTIDRSAARLQYHCYLFLS